MTSKTKPKKNKTGGSTPLRNFKLQVFLSPEWKEAITVAAEQKNMKLSQFARFALAEQFPLHVRKALPEPQQGRRTDLE